MQKNMRWFGLINIYNHVESDKKTTASLRLVNRVFQFYKSNIEDAKKKLLFLNITLLIGIILQDV